jgi:anti-sigma factor RsiW
MTEPSCGRVRELAAELALGVLPGDERAAALDHLAGCPDCRKLVRELTGIGDDLLGLVPGVEPPVGFEDRVLARIQPRRRRPRPRRWLPIAIAAAVAALVFGLGGWIVGGYTW